MWCYWYEYFLQNTTFDLTSLLDGSVWDNILFSYTTKVVMLGYTAESMEIGDLPIVPGNMRATTLFKRMKEATKKVKLSGKWKPQPGSGWELAYRLLVLNGQAFGIQICLAAVSACFFYAPAFFLQKLVLYLEEDFGRKNVAWGWVYCAGLFFMNVICFLGKSLVRMLSYIYFSNHYR